MKKSPKKKSQSSRNQGFSYYFPLVIEGSGSIPLTNGSGSGSRRPNNIRIRRIRIRNTACQELWAPNWNRRYPVPGTTGSGSGSATLLWCKKQGRIWTRQHCTAYFSQRPTTFTLCAGGGRGRGGWVPVILELRNMVCCSMNLLLIPNLTSVKNMHRVQLVFGTINEKGYSVPVPNKGRYVCTVLFSNLFIRFCTDIASLGICCRYKNGTLVPVYR